VLAALLLLATGLLAFRSVDDLDYGIHVATGRWILANGEVPRLDPFTWTLGDHPYVAYHWGFQVVLASLEGALGTLGPVLLRWALVVGTALFLLGTLRRRRVEPGLAAAIGLLALVAAEWRFAVRPELMTDLGLAALLWLLERRRSGGNLPLWALPALFLLWVNAHIYLLGVIVLGIEMVAEAVRGRLDRRLVLGAASALGALLLNPYHEDAVLEPLRLLTRLDADNVFAQHITELQSPLAIAEDPRAPYQLDLQVGAWRALLLLTLPAAWGLLRSGRWSDLGVLLTFAGLSTLAVRNLPLFAIASLPALVSGLDGLFVRGRSWSPWRPALAWGVAAATAILAVRVGSGAWYASQRRELRLRPIVEEATLAVGAARRVRELGLRGPLFNNLDVGGALLLEAPGVRIYIDGRNEVTGEHFFQSYLAATRPDGFDRMAAEKGIEVVVLSHRQCLSLVQHLLRSSRWTLVHYDAVAVVFVRKGGLNAGVAEARWPAPVTETERWALLSAVRPRPSGLDRGRRWLIGGERSPEAWNRLGTFILTLGAWKEAERPLLAASIEAPNFWETSNNLGALYTRLGHDEAAVTAYRTVLMLRPGNELATRREREAWARIQGKVPP
jgi:tetratricopeptide (TPR) repeat protein